MGVAGEIVWLDATRYDEAIAFADSLFERGSERSLCRGFDEQAGCEIDCWAYLRRRA